MPGGPEAQGAAAGGAEEGPVSLGTATVEELDTIEGIGPVTAQSIVDYRDEQGGFSSVEELDEISGIGPATMEALRAGLHAVAGALPDWRAFALAGAAAGVGVSPLLGVGPPAFAWLLVPLAAGLVALRPRPASPHREPMSPRRRRSPRPSPPGSASSP